MNSNYQQRRTFRGRGGATDRRLPKQNAGRRRPNRNNDDDENPPSTLSRESPAVVSEGEENDDDLVVIVSTETNLGNDVRIPALPLTDTTGSNDLDDIENQEDSSPPPPYLKETKHLKRRMRNVQEISIQTSRDSIASDLSKYQNNVLNATQNCVNEWRSISRHYSSKNNDDNDSANDNDKCIPSELRTEVGLAVFQLVQLTVQSGPLSGAKPGYFKRCGSDVAKVVLDFLEEVVPQHNALGMDCMGFSSKQMNAMNKWKVNAGKAVENNKPPSKSVMKKMQPKNQPTKKAKKKKKT